ncbi:putative Late nodulin [Medicago truncatula]|uniref:Putative Late nodulin n=1 Tax=Medicago truncatula TaxID=3880 RepID=A0A396H5F7_MEDTR|nr:putative Late nodulin [Medicago truncatula]
MVKILKFADALIIFLSLIVLVTSNDRVFCLTSKDCRCHKCFAREVPKCFLFMCVCYRI